MNMVVDAKSDALPSATHIDGSCRVQTVTREQNEKYYLLLQEMGRLCNIPVLLNTSFNLKDQTITLDPDQAIKRFLESKINFLVINNFLIKKKDYIKRIQKVIRKWQKEKEYQKKLAELRKRDPFNYKNF